MSIETLRDPITGKLPAYRLLYQWKIGYTWFWGGETREGDILHFRMGITDHEPKQLTEAPS